MLKTMLNDARNNIRKFLLNRFSVLGCYPPIWVYYMLCVLYPKKALANSLNKYIGYNIANDTFYIDGKEYPAEIFMELANFNTSKILTSRGGKVYVDDRVDDRVNNILYSLYNDPSIPRPTKQEDNPLDHVLYYLSELKDSRDLAVYQLNKLKEDKLNE